MPGCEIRIDDTVPGGGDGAGEVLVRGPNVMKGYYRNPEATALVLDSDGWMHTGDLGRIDSKGFLHILGRTKELIIHGGFNVYPPEVEEALLTHPAVAMAAVVGVEHERLGQEVGAVIQLRPGANATGTQLATHVEERIARFKVPRHWRFVDAMPLTVSGKVRKVELEGMFGGQP